MSIAQLADKSNDQEEHAMEDDEKEDIETSEDSDEDGEEDEDESDGEDEMVRKLNEQLLEDIRRAREARETAARSPTTIPKTSSKEEAALTTIKNVLSFAASDPLVHRTLSDTLVPGHPGSNVLGMLNNVVEERRITPQVAGSLSHALVKLAKSEVLFSPLPSLLSETLKRKRDGAEEENGPSEKRIANQ